LALTETELRFLAALAIIGLKRTPNNGRAARPSELCRAEIPSLSLRPLRINLPKQTQGFPAD
jgi:hypothetical protein